MLNFLVPPRCLMCNTQVLSSGLVCAPCFKQLDFIEKPCCLLCARPFISDVEAGQKHICTKCASLFIPWKNCRASFVYNEGFKNIIMPLKYGDQQKSLNFLTHFMYRSARDLIDWADYIIPVPLHKYRLRYRKYNQSALLAWQLGKKGNKSVLPMGLIRIKDTTILGHLNAQERQLILKDAFITNPKHKLTLQHKRVLLIDDVMTTGATLRECSFALLASGVEHIDILVAAKVK